MRYVIALLVALSSSYAAAGEVWIPESPYHSRPVHSCRPYSVPVANYYRVTRDPFTGYVYSREYIGTRYEQRTYCEPRGRYGFEPWIQPIGYGQGSLRYSVFGEAE